MTTYYIGKNDSKTEKRQTSRAENGGVGELASDSQFSLVLGLQKLGALFHEGGLRLSSTKIIFIENTIKIYSFSCCIPI